MRATPTYSADVICRGKGGHLNTTLITKIRIHVWQHFPVELQSDERFLSIFQSTMIHAFLRNWGRSVVANVAHLRHCQSENLPSFCNRSLVSGKVNIKEATTKSSVAQLQGPN